MALYCDDCTVLERVLLPVLHAVASIAIAAALWLGYLRGPIALIAMLVLVVFLTSLSTTAVCALSKRFRAVARNRA